MSDFLARLNTGTLEFACWTGLLLVWVLLWALFAAISRIWKLLGKLIDASDTASSMRFGFLEAVSCLCLIALMAVLERFDCAAFWGAWGVAIGAVFICKGWQKSIEDRNGDDAPRPPSAP